MINGKEKAFPNREIIFGDFEKALEYNKLMQENKFLADDYPLSELKEAKKFVCHYFDVTEEQSSEGFLMRDSIDFFGLFGKVLNNIQLDDGRREVTVNDEGK